MRHETHTLLVGVPVKVWQDASGMWHAGSPLIKGLIVVAHTRERVMQLAPEYLSDLCEAAHMIIDGRL